MSRHVLAFALIAALAACAPSQQAPAEEAATGEPPAVVDQPVEDVPPATTPAPDPEPAGNTDSPARFDGYGDTRFGMDEAAFRAAWKGELASYEFEEKQYCFHLWPKEQANSAALAFMFGDTKFARYSTQNPELVAPGGGKIGMTKAEIVALYGEVKAEPHAYSNGEYLVVKDAANGSSAIFETDEKSDGAKVTEWRVGVEPYVGYIEGCS